MQQGNYLADSDSPAFRRSVPVDAARPVAPQQITPTDGAVVHMADRDSVYCASCGRWIDCYEDIAPETVLVRHGNLFH
jgi:hypothetical protein